MASYTKKTTWAAGQDVLGSDLNRWEQGIDDAITGVNSNASNIATNTTAITNLTTGDRPGVVVGSGSITAPTSNNSTTVGPGAVPLRALNVPIQAGVAYSAHLYVPLVVLTAAAVGRSFSISLRHRAGNTADAFALYVNMLNMWSAVSGTSRPAVGSIMLPIPANDIPAGARDFEVALVVGTASDVIQLYAGLGPTDTFGFPPATLEIIRR